MMMMYSNWTQMKTTTYPALKRACGQETRKTKKRVKFDMKEVPGATPMPPPEPTPINDKAGEKRDSPPHMANYDSLQT
jgi:hypothetical protein